MMVNKISFKRLLAFLAVLIMAVSVSLTAFAADDDEEDKEPAGMPIINVISGNIYEIEPGQETNIALRVRNTSTSVAKSVVVIPTVENASENPLKVTLNAQSSNIGTISANGERTINLTVAADRTAATKTYAINIKFQFLNNDGVSYDSTSTIYFKIKNASGVPVFNFQNYKLNPTTLNAGDSSVLTFELFNKGPLNLYNAVVSLENLDPAGVGVNGTNQKKFSKIWAGTKETLSFNLTTNSAMEDGSYPVTVKVVFNDENGTEHTYEEKYFVSVGAGSGKNADLRIENVKEPGGTFGVNQNFDFSFTVKNYGDAVAENIRISAAEYGEGGNIVPKSNSTFSLKELQPGKSADYTFTFAPTGNASTRNYTVEFKLEYKMGGKDYTVTQYAGANVSNPEKDKEEDGDKKESKPKIIVSDYKCDPVIVMAGENFDLTMTFLNTHVEKAVKNVKMYLTMIEETSSENEKSGNVFTPVDSSNTFYYDSIAPKGTVSKTMTLYTVPSAQPKTYTLTVNFEYEDESGNEYTATELLGINVKQVSQIDTSEIFVPESSEIGMPISVYFDIHNTGKVDISNLKVSLEGDITTQNKSTYIGNCSPGDSNYYEGSFSVNNIGLNNFKLTISYDDPSGEQIQQVKEYTINGVEPVMDDTMGGEMMPDDMDMNQGLSLKAKIGIGVGAVVGIIILVVVLKVIKKRKDARLIADDLDDDDMEGKDENEQL